MKSFLADGSGCILITEVGKTTKPLSRRLNVGQSPTFGFWFDDYSLQIPVNGSTSSGGWSVMKTTNSLDLYKPRMPLKEYLDVLLLNFL